MELVNENKKILPVANPVITTYTQHAHLLSILGNHEQAYSWIYSNYIQLYINKDYKNNWGDFYFPFPYELRPSDSCKWIQSQKIDRNIINSKWEGVISFIIDCINSNTYVHTMINYYFVPISRRYHTRNAMHDIFIYGFDLNEKILYVSDFFMNGKYSNEKISFLDFIQAFDTYKLCNNKDYLNGMVYLYKFNEKSDYKFNIINIINSIKSYLLSSAPEYWNMYNADNREDIVFGKDIYTTLKNYVLKEQISEDNSFVDIRPFYMLCDHKKIMSLRLKYLIKQGYFKHVDNCNNIRSIDEIEIKTKNIVNLIIKYNVSKNNALISRIIDLLEYIEEKEYNILKQYILN